MVKVRNEWTFGHLLNFKSLVNVISLFISNQIKSFSPKIKNLRSLTNPVANVKMKAKVTEGNVDFILSLGYTTGFVKEPKSIRLVKILNPSQPNLTKKKTILNVIHI